jgi:regulator of protease activity HflC (stomatin/prohibitin superfamily)
MTSGLGIDKLLEWIEKILWWLIPWVIIDHYSRGICLRFGKPRKNPLFVLVFHLIWAIGIEEVLDVNVKPDGWQIQEQSLTLKDGTQISLSYVIVWTIPDPVQLILEVEDKVTVHSSIQGYVQEFLSAYNWAELQELRAWAAESGKRHGIRERLTRYAHAQTRHWSGVEVQDILIRDFVLTSLKDGVIRVMSS